MSLRRCFAAAGLVLAMAVLLGAIQSLSAWMTRAQLQQDAAHTLETLRRGQPLWRWQLRQPADLIAGRAFGSARVTQDGDQLRITSLDGSPYDLGLPLAQPIDLAHWPLLHLHIESSAPGQLGLIWQANNQSTCLNADAAKLSTGVQNLTIDLRQWHPDGACSSPGVTQLLRLRPQLPAGSWLRLGMAELRAATAPSIPDAHDVGSSFTLANDPAEAQAQIAAWGKNSHPPAVPWVRLPSEAPAETLLALRDRLRPLWPAALILPASATLSESVRQPLPAWIGWACCGGYLLLLGLFALRKSITIKRSPSGKPWLDLVLILAAPLWLIAGLQWGLHLSVPGVIAFAAALVYALHSEWRQRPWSWQWLGRRGSDWLWPLALLPVAAGLCLVFGHHWVWPGLRHVLTYLAWACLQQWLMLVVVQRRLQQMRLAPMAQMLVIASLFALLHTPNGALMQLCLLAELWWAWCFLRSRCLLPIALAHASCALLVESGLTGSLVRSLEISARFFL
ncbi:CPBP family glutamic-type intramembrane protease [Dyella silvatica]|uniref:CPBP family glutamic-type intramembrane protease n=1 Tax=Dyella silvatica TaxID=2992128 RepID=UPI002250D1C5|nr:CPBP family intramembrane glutamic endopeptidase [Dyella silvatica]